MSFGLQCWNASGALTVDSSSTVTRYIETFTTNGTAGSMTISALSTGRPWVAAYRYTNNSVQYIAADVTVSGTTVSWTYTAGGGSSNWAPMIIFAGVY
jgi:hypothetical protein